MSLHVLILLVAYEVQFYIISLFKKKYSVEKVMSNRSLLKLSSLDQSTKNGGKVVLYTLVYDPYLQRTATIGTTRTSVQLLEQLYKNTGSLDHLQRNATKSTPGLYDSTVFQHVNREL